MTPTIKAWIDKRTKFCSPNAKYLEVGSRNINGAPERRSPHYIGIDKIDGVGVDMVADGQNIPFHDNCFDCVICAETLEHDTAPWVTAKEIIRVVKPGGLVIVTVPGIMFGHHDFPSDYWRFTADGMKELFKDLEIMECIEDRTECNVKLFGKKLLSDAPIAEAPDMQGPW